MTEEQIKKIITRQEDGLELICAEWRWRNQALCHYRNELKKIDDLVIFCQTGKFPL